MPVAEYFSQDYLSAREPDRALVILSGTHGVEGFSGSGCQVGVYGRTADFIYRGCRGLANSSSP